MSANPTTPPRPTVPSAVTGGVRVVVRVRPMNDAEKRRCGNNNCAAAVYPLMGESSSSPDSPGASSSCSSMDSQASSSSRNSFRRGVGDVLSKIPSRLVRGVKKKKKHKKEDADNDDNDATPTPLARNTSNSTNYFATQQHPKVCVAGSRQFEFDAVFGAETSQEQVYDFVGDCVPDVLNGFNATILAYGQTGAGKTYTMGNHDGVIARAITDIFKGKEENDSVDDDDGVTKITMSCLEIYKENLCDLLSGSETVAAASLKLRDNGDSVEVSGLQAVAVETDSQVHQLLEEANQRRTTGSTRLNERSSRSHAVYTLFVTTKKGGNVVTGKLTLVDLAGSERIKDSGAVGSQQKESININKDLFVLGKVVSALANRSTSKTGGVSGSATKARNHHVPYRDSKLTRLLRDALGGNCRTVFLIACVSPASIHTDETLNTLRYAERTRLIKNFAKQNVFDGSAAVLTPAQCSALRAENRVLRARIANLTRRGAADFNPSALLLGGGPSPSRKVGAEFSGLEAKLQKAKELAQATKDSCQNMASPAARLKERYEKFENMKQKAEEKGEMGDAFHNDEVARKMEEDIESLVREKVTLFDDLLHLFRQYETKSAELRSVELSFFQQNFSFHDTFEEEERKRDVIRQDVLQLQQSIQQIACDMKENEEVLQSIAQALCSGSAEYYDGRGRNRNLELRCESLAQDVDFLNNENDILRNQNKSLALRLRKELAQSEKVEGDDDGGLESPTGSESESSSEEQVEELSSDPKKIRSHAEDLLDWADRAIEKARKSQDSTCDSSLTSTLGTDLKPSSLNMSGASRIERFRFEDEEGSKPGENNDENHLVISNIDNMNVDPCPCQTSVLASKPEHVEFYLPEIGILCSCGRKKEVPFKGGDPCALSNILRQWQVDFLASMEIHTAVDMVHACTERSKSLAKKMRQWRKKKGMKAVRTKSCRVALHVWARTCKAVVKSVQENKANGGDGVRPDFLDVSLASDSYTVSTLGFGGGSVSGPLFSHNEDEL